MSKQIIIDYQEYLDMQSELDFLKKPAEGTELSEAEHQEATGILLIRALQNPDVIRMSAGNSGVLDIGKYKAIFTIPAVTDQEIRVTVRVKFERN